MHPADPATARVLLDDDRTDPPPDLQGTAGGVLLAYLHTQSSVLRSVARSARDGDAEGVHRMRVAARRLRSGLQAGRRVLDRRRTAELVAQLRWLGRELGPVRDLDVQDAHLTAALAQRPPEEVPGPVLAELTRWYSPRRAAAAAAAREALESTHFVNLLVALDELLLDPPLTARATRRPPGQWRRILRKAAERVRRSHEAALRQPAGPDRDQELHATRKAAKRLRYAAEAAEPELSGASRIAKRAKRVQRELGAHHDAITIRPVLRELAAHAHADGGTGFAHGVLHEAAAADATRAEAAAHERMGKLERAVRRLR